jgi:TM2 domain-containing membrane protein YozV
MRNKVTAGILSLMLGGIGIHKFYLGKFGQGIIYFLFCWTIIPLILSIIEGIKILTMTEEQFAVNYNSGVMAAPASPVNVADEIEKLFRLKESGAITPAEYEAKKTNLLA